MYLLLYCVTFSRTMFTIQKSTKIMCDKFHLQETWPPPIMLPKVGFKRDNYSVKGWKWDIFSRARSQCLISTKNSPTVFCPIYVWIPLFHHLKEYYEIDDEARPLSGIFPHTFFFNAFLIMKLGKLPSFREWSELYIASQSTFEN